MTADSGEVQGESVEVVAKGLQKAQEEALYEPDSDQNRWSQGRLVRTSF